MILYDKNSNFLGMSQIELHMLGFEDMEEFKSYHNDFANLFVEKPGYIFNFKNFSWIDYTLHSGAPNKSVILKHKNGTEIEAKLNISEIYLIEDINNHNTLYNIEIISSSLQKFGSVQPIEDNDTQEEKPTQQIEIKEDERITNYNLSNIEDITNDNDRFLVNEGEDIKENFSQEEPPVDNITTQDEYNLENINPDIVPDIKLKIDTQPTIEDDKELPNSDFIEPFPIDNISIKQEKPDYSDIEFKEPDFIKIAEETGLDLSTIASLVEDFIIEAKEISIKIRHSQDKESIENELLKLIGIAHNLKIDSLVIILEKLLTQIKNSDFNLEEGLNLFIKHIQLLEESIS